MNARIFVTLAALALPASVFVACGGKPASNTAVTAPSTNAPSSSSVEPVSVVTVSSSLKTMLDAPDRATDDRALDEQRHAGETLAFFGVSPGMHVADLAAGRGYTTELLARAVAPNGVVYGQNNKFITEKFAEKPWSERLAKPAMKGVVRVDREFDDPLPPEAKELDLVIFVLFYHDTVWMKTDRAKMNAAVFASLKHGGTYGVIDHSGRDGTGTTEAMSFHRIEEKVVVQEVEAAGFRLTREASFMRNPADSRDWNDSPSAAGARRGTSDRFVLSFTKP